MAEPEERVELQAMACISITRGRAVDLPRLRCSSSQSRGNQERQERRAVLLSIGTRRGEYVRNMDTSGYFGQFCTQPRISRATHRPVCRSHRRPGRRAGGPLAQWRGPGWGGVVRGDYPGAGAVQWSVVHADLQRRRQSLSDGYHAGYILRRSAGWVLRRNGRGYQRPTAAWW